MTTMTEPRLRPGDMIKVGNIVKPSRKNKYKYMFPTKADLMRIGVIISVKDTFGGPYLNIMWLDTAEQVTLPTSYVTLVSR